MNLTTEQKISFFNSMHHKWGKLEWDEKSKQYTTTLKSNHHVIGTFSELDIDCKIIEYLKLLCQNEEIMEKVINRLCEILEQTGEGCWCCYDEGSKQYYRSDIGDSNEMYLTSALDLIWQAILCNMTLTEIQENLEQWNFL